MRSVRLDPDLEDRLLRAAAVRGESPSEFIRRAAADRADATLDADAGDFADVLGVVHGGGGRARRTGEAFTDVVSERSSRG
ncbi:MAG: ribbon-helix-helix protein, CopG family [Nocardioidaceae bacterium]|jgi:hypothetical protein|nr:ribbon-helix-helix protein, CopG family [Nocardioidaceae bacterium]